MKCPYCGKENEAKATICVQCRAEIPAKKKPEKAEKKTTTKE